MSRARVRWLDRAPSDWPALLASDPGASPAHQPGVWHALADHAPGFELALAVVEEPEGTIGGAPALIERRGGLRWFHALPRLLPGAPLARPGRHAEVDERIAHAFAARARELRVVGGEWACYRPCGEAPSADALAILPGETRRFRAALVDLRGGLDAALARLDRKVRQSLQHARSRRLDFGEDPAALEPGYALHVAQSRAWSGHRPLPLELARRLLAPGAGGRLFALRDAGGVVSAALALDGPHETFVWWSGTHAEGRRRGAGPLLLWRIVEWAAAAGRVRVNLGASTGLEGVAAFKHGLGADAFEYPVRWLDARHASLLGRAVALAQARLRRDRARGEAA
ncbi:MAG TPA: GNAT family N-acetyltransferase [Candidatus Acidoferrales bacterium]|nr:GNAT family N-acetyltransferase [Candidatus Acidoferrales bacterium]